MQINRQNYEQYFLLYADGELTTSQRNAVEIFVAENTDLAIELEMIEAAILPTEEIHYTDKGFLYKDIVMDDAMQQNLLLKLDNELPANQLVELDNLLQQNSEVSNEYNLLSKAVLDKNEKIIFENKHLLYKKEKDNVIPFGFIRWAAAAMFIGVALFVGVKFYNNKNNADQPIAKINGENSAKKTITTNQINNNQNDEVNTSSTPKNIEPLLVKQNNSNDAIINTKENTLVKENKKNVNIKNAVTNNKYERITNINNENVENNNKNNFIVQQEIKLPEENNSNGIMENNTAIAKTIDVKNNLNTERLYELENTYTYQNVVLKEEDNTENKIFYINESKIKKSKIGTFFNRIKNAVQKTAKVKPGNTIQVAGFEISGN